jgi:hypothetical protein
VGQEIALRIEEHQFDLDGAVADWDWFQANHIQASGLFAGDPDHAQCRRVRLRIKGSDSIPRDKHVRCHKGARQYGYRGYSLQYRH